MSNAFAGAASGAVSRQPAEGTCGGSGGSAGISSGLHRLVRRVVHGAAAVKQEALDSPQLDQGQQPAHADAATGVPPLPPQPQLQQAPPVGHTPRHQQQPHEQQPGQQLEHQQQQQREQQPGQQQRQQSPSKPSGSAGMAAPEPTPTPPAARERPLAAQHAQHGSVAAQAHAARTDSSTHVKTADTKQTTAGVSHAPAPAVGAATGYALAQPQAAAAAATAAAARAGGSKGRRAGPGPSAGRMSWPWGVCRQGRTCIARISVPLDSQGRPSASAARKEIVVCRLGSMVEGAVARDLALTWRQLRMGASLDEARERFNYQPASLRRFKPALTQLRACASVDDLQSLFVKLESNGTLRQIAASLASAAADPAAAAAAEDATDAGAAGAAASAVQPKRGHGGRSRSGKRARGDRVNAAAAAAAAARAAPVVVGKRKREVEEAAAVADRALVLQAHVKREAVEEQTPLPQQAEERGGLGRHGGAAALGRRVRVLLTLDGVRQRHEGRVEEFTPTGKHHVLFDDGEEALLDLGQAEHQFLTPQIPAATPEAAVPAVMAAAGAAAEGSAEAAADVGQRLHVWWPQEGRAGDWYGGRITHVLRSGLLCVRYDSDGSELLLDPLDPQQRVQWAWLPRQQQHERHLRDHRREQRAVVAAAQQAQQAEEDEEAWLRAEAQLAPGGLAAARQRQQQAAWGQQQQQAQQQQPQQQQPQQPHAVPAAAVPHAVPAVPADLFQLLLDASAAPAASAQGLTAALVGSFQALLDTLPAQQQAVKERRLRVLLALQEFGGAAALMRTAVGLGLLPAAQRSGPGQ